MLIYKAFFDFFWSGNTKDEEKTVLASTSFFAAHEWLVDVDVVVFRSPGANPIK